jgi:uncharacterized membrane protein YphA (DoxX/SURF4 family)
MRFNKTLWTVQVLLAVLFLFAGVFKWVAPIEAMEGPVALPGYFIRFIGLAETLGGIGLVLPMAVRILPGLTPIAAAGLTIIMIGATTISAPFGMGAATFPALVGVLTTAVCLGRRSVLRAQEAVGIAERNPISA